MKSKLITFVAVPALILALIAVPAVGFAKDHVEKHSNRGSFDFSGWFGLKTEKAHAQIDVNRAPSISGITAPTVLEVGTEGTWTVNASDPENGALSYSVDWGDNMIKSLFRFGGDTFVQDSSFTHTYDNPGTYTARFTVKDEQGRSSSSSVTVRVTRDETQELAISDVHAVAVSETRARITWSTNLKSNTTVFYSIESPVDTETDPSVSHRGQVFKHRINLTDLVPGTTYYVIVQSENRAGESVRSDEYSFTTPSSENQVPSISSIDGPEVLKVDEEGTWTVNASDPENSALSYSVDWGDTNALGKMLAFLDSAGFTQTSTFSHTYGAAGTYLITVTVKDEAGLTAKTTATVEVTDDTVATPIISGITALVGAHAITFAWDTDVLANTEIHYATVSPVETDGTASVHVVDETLVSDHSLEVKDLTANTLYHFILQSENVDGEVDATSEFSLMTMGI